MKFNLIIFGEGIKLLTSHKNIVKVATYHVFHNQNILWFCYLHHKHKLDDF